MKRTIFGVPLPLVIVAVGAAGYLFWRQRQQSQQAATAAQTAATATAQQSSGAGATAGDPALVAYQAGEASGVSSYASGVSQGIGLIESVMGQFPTVSPGSTSSPSPTPAPTTNPTGSSGSSGQPGYGVISTAQGPMVVLGEVSQPGYQVSGGAPVYFGNAQNLTQGDSLNSYPNYAYTPESYASFVSKTPEGVIG